MDPTRLGQLALAYGMIETEDLERCLRLQERSDPPRYLGEILVAEGLIDGQGLRRLLSAQRKELEAEDAERGPRFERTEIAQRLENANLRDYLEVLVDLGGQELHLAAGSRPMLRRNGALISLRPREMSAEEAWNVLGGGLSDTSWERFSKLHTHHFVYDGRELGRFRAGYFFQSRGPSAVFCSIPSQLPHIEALGLPSVVEELPQLRRGLVLLTGTRGSGRSTSLAAIVELINERARRHIVCLDEAIEFAHQSKLSLITQRQVGRDVPNWPGAFSAAMREDPDVLVLGDLNPPARMLSALNAADVGLLVIGTVGGRSVDQALLSIAKGVAPDRRDQVCNALAEHLRFVISQQLVPGADGEHLQLAAEVLRNTPGVADAVRQLRFHQLRRLVEISRGEGMQTMDQALQALVAEERITPGDALARAHDNERLFDQIRALGKA